MLVSSGRHRAHHLCRRHGPRRAQTRQPQVHRNVTCPPRRMCASARSWCRGSPLLDESGASPSWLRGQTEAIDLSTKTVSTVDDLVAVAADTAVRRILVDGEISGVPSLRLASGQQLAGKRDGATVIFAGGRDGVQLSRDNEVARPRRPGHTAVGRRRRDARGLHAVEHAVRQRCGDHRGSAWHRGRSEEHPGVRQRCLLAKGTHDTISGGATGVWSTAG